MKLPMNKAFICVLLVGSGWAMPATAQQTRQDTTSPACATPSNMRPGGADPRQRSDVPPPLHQPAGTGSYHPGTSSISSPTNGVNGSPHTREMPPQPGPPVSSQQLYLDSATDATNSPQQNMKTGSQLYHLQTRVPDNPNCVEMNFRDVDSCDPCLVAPACPDLPPGSAVWDDRCETTMPGAAMPEPQPEQQIVERFEDLPAFDQAPTDRTDAWGPSQSYELGSKTVPSRSVDYGPVDVSPPGSEPSAHYDHRQPDELMLQPPAVPSANAAASSHASPDQGGYIFENAAFQHPYRPRQDAEVHDTAVHLTNQAAEIVIHPPMIQPYNQHQHTFVIENRGQVDAAALSIEISVPEEVKIVAALPNNSVTTPRAAVFRFDRLIAGDQAVIHVTAISTNKQTIPFEVSVASRSQYSFHVHDQPIAGVLKNVSHEGGATPTATAIPAVDDEFGPVIVRNPYVQSLPQNHEAARRTNRR